MIRTDEDDEFERIERENSMKGQPYIYESKREWVGLTDEEIWACLPKDPDEMVFARAIESKLKERNT
jgi:hypothetical protein